MCTSRDKTKSNFFSRRGRCTFFTSIILLCVMRTYTVFANAISNVRVQRVFFFFFYRTVYSSSGDVGRSDTTIRVVFWVSGPYPPRIRPWIVLMEISFGNRCKKCPIYCPISRQSYKTYNDRALVVDTARSVDIHIWPQTFVHRARVVLSPVCSEMLEFSGWYYLHYTF